MYVASGFIKGGAVCRVKHYQWLCTIAVLRVANGAKGNEFG